MRRLVLAMLATLSLATSAAAAEDGSGAPPRAPMTERKVEILQHPTSGFWTSNAPAERGREYRWRLLGIGIVLASGFGFLMWRLTRRANAERAARTTAPRP